MGRSTAEQLHSVGCDGGFHTAVAFAATAAKQTACVGGIQQRKQQQATQQAIEALSIRAVWHPVKRQGCGVLMPCGSGSGSVAASMLITLGGCSCYQQGTAAQQGVLSAPSAVALQRLLPGGALPPLILDYRLMYGSLPRATGQCPCAPLPLYFTCPLRSAPLPRPGEAPRCDQGHRAT